MTMIKELMRIKIIKKKIQEMYAIKTPKLEYSIFFFFHCDFELRSFDCNLKEEKKKKKKFHFLDAIYVSIVQCN